MIVSAICAMDRNGLIGDGMKMPWHLPVDLKRFKLLTIGKPIIMGRRTFDSLGKPLPGRLNIVLSKNQPTEVEGYRLARSLDEALKIAGEYNATTDDDEVMIIGGGVIFDATAHLWDRLLLTIVEGEFSGDTYFSQEILRRSKWRLTNQIDCKPDEKNKHSHTFLDLERINDESEHADIFDIIAWLSEQKS
jgi:dihydrofolate reductase